jgi:hypothetical protein
LQLVTAGSFKSGIYYWVVAITNPITIQTM